MRRDKLYGSFGGTQSTASFSRDFARAPCSWCVTTSTRCSRCDRDMLPCNPKECCKNAAREQIGEALVCRPAPRTQRSVRLQLMPQHGAAQKSKSSGGWRLCLCRILRETGNASITPALSALYSVGSTQAYAVALGPLLAQWLRRALRRAGERWPSADPFAPQSDQRSILTERKREAFRLRLVTNQPFCSHTKLSSPNRSVISLSFLFSLQALGQGPGQFRQRGPVRAAVACNRGFRNSARCLPTRFCIAPLT